jgi:hypothetical protein
MVNEKGLHVPAAGSKDSPDCADRFPGVPHQKGDVTQLRHARQKPHVLAKMNWHTAGKNKLAYRWQNELA